MIVGLAASGGYKHWDVIESAFDESTVSLRAAMAAGVFLMVLPGIGMCGAKLRESSFGRFFLYIYALLLVLIIILEVVASVYIMAALGYVNKPKSLANKVNKWTEEEYGYCCPAAGGSPDSSQCVLSKISKSDDASFCGDSYDDFKRNLKNWLKDNLHPVAIMMFTVAMLQIVLLIASCCAISHGRRDQAKKEAAEKQQGYYRAPDVENGQSAAPQHGQPQTGGAIRY